MIDVLFDHELFSSPEELQVLIQNGVKSFGDLCQCAQKEPRVVKPLLNRYINWFNKNVAPRALVNVGF